MVERVKRGDGMPLAPFVERKKGLKAWTGRSAAAAMVDQANGGSGGDSASCGVGDSRHLAEGAWTGSTRSLTGHVCSATFAEVALKGS